MTRSPIAALPSILTLALACTLGGCVTPGGAEARDLAERRHGISVRFGSAHLDDDLKPFDRARSGALEYSYGQPGSPWRFFGGVSHTSDAARPDQTFTLRNGSTFDAPVRIEGELSEIYGGVRHEWSAAKGRIRPYLGGGLSLVFGSVESSPPPFQQHPTDMNLDVFPPAKIDDDDETLGLFTQAGVAVPLGDGFQVSADWRWLLLAELDVLGGEQDVGYQLLAVSLGWRF